jgi:hypothetical protein
MSHDPTLACHAVVGGLTLSAMRVQFVTPGQRSV